MFDPDGVELTLDEPSADRATIERLTRDGSDVVVADCGAALQWLRGAEARDAWARRERDFEDVVDWKAPPGAPGELPYRGEVWRYGDRRIVVLSNE
jgi:hypothetical protein